MSNELRVNADELRIAAAQLEMHAADLHEHHTAAHANMASAVPGFGTGLSAAALTERIAQWEEETAIHHAELGKHSDGHRLGSANYATTDSDCSAQIMVAAGNFDEASGAVDL
jgi:hypothetical protein